jgi:hypothetical protein
MYQLKINYENKFPFSYEQYTNESQSFHDEGFGRFLLISAKVRVAAPMAIGGGLQGAAPIDIGGEGACCGD